MSLFSQGQICFSSIHMLAVVVVGHILGEVTLQFYGVLWLRTSTRVYIFILFCLIGSKLQVIRSP